MVTLLKELIEEMCLLPDCMSAVKESKNFKAWSIENICTLSNDLKDSTRHELVKLVSIRTETLPHWCFELRSKLLNCHKALITICSLGVLDFLHISCEQSSCERHLKLKFREYVVNAIHRYFW